MGQIAGVDGFNIGKKNICTGTAYNSVIIIVKKLPGNDNLRSWFGSHLINKRIYCVNGNTFKMLKQQLKSFLFEERTTSIANLTSRK